MNLAINAAEAIGSNAGLITVRTGPEIVNQEYVRRHPEAADLPHGRYVALEVADTGCGMEASVKARDFRSFLLHEIHGTGFGFLWPSPALCAAIRALFS